MRIHVVDAFSARPFAGNPAGVCLLDPGPWPGDRWMQQVAAEMKHAETAFALPLEEGADGDWGLRWFTPSVEVALCGHATVATGHVLRTDRGVTGTVRFRTVHSGVLTTHTEPGGTARESRVALDFPAAVVTPAPVPDGLAEALRVAPEAVHSTGDLGDLLVVLPDEATVRNLRPDVEALDALTRDAGARGVIVTAGADRPEAEYAVVSRFFAPAQGVAEDPVTGSAHTALAPYWAVRLGRDRFTGLQVSERSGEVGMELRGERVALTGRAVTVLEGDLLV
ncbi:PhzF family phenazine biosynthesis protein [Streptomyces sp. AJS327]|uniref:PhzF family phenazine biosynthesis protein n=1 Tax=Streptomyces sp. AJS327 TaxID=2545265 RepID=UPI0015E02E05|nr:PhzF family phenazine biosynthesis protein [Streptomyces sp. AJS327]MBA0052091.1 PhzF family phenazine biosynthesis protein [Streptomyces sp. AJS327]